MARSVTDRRRLVVGGRFPIDGGHKTNSFLHFVLLTWVGGLIGVLTKTLVEVILTI